VTDETQIPAAPDAPDDDAAWADLRAAGSDLVAVCDIDSGRAEALTHARQVEDVLHSAQAVQARIEKSQQVSHHHLIQEQRAVTVGPLPMQMGQLVFQQAEKPPADHLLLGARHRRRTFGIGLGTRHGHSKRDILR
jgi:hypothetical protein